MVVVPTEKELLARIRQLEEMNSALQDKLDMIYSIVSPEFEDEMPAAEGDEGDDDDGGLVQIAGVRPKRTN